MFPQSNKCFYKHPDVMLILQEPARFVMQAISGVLIEKKEGPSKFYSQESWFWPKDTKKKSSSENTTKDQSQ